jgi:uncharacterized protein (DUF1697 family)
MNTYVILMRGINVGGKNKIPMTELKLFLEEQGFDNVMTFIQSGNVILMLCTLFKRSREWQSLTQL